jgi:purine nucleosidase
MRPFLIDSDTGSDDAVALVMALNYPGIRVEAITLVAGNVPVDQGVQNALYTVELCGADVPVYRGAERPLLRALHTGESVHGQDGMGDIGLPLSGREAAPGHAVGTIIEVIERHAGEITVVTLGPLTNLALALRQAPGIASKVHRCVMMGGTGYGYGNVTPVAEYNIWADPEAAKIVFESGMPLTMVGWDISYKYATFDPEQSAELRGIGTELARFCVDIQATLNAFALTKTHLPGYDLPDPIAMAVALEPDVSTRERLFYVEIETTSELCRGQTVVDHLDVMGREPNVLVVQEASREHFLRLLYEAVRPAANA